MEEVKPKATEKDGIQYQDKSLLIAFLAFLDWWDSNTENKIDEFFFGWSFTSENLLVGPSSDEFKALVMKKIRNWLFRQGTFGSISGFFGPSAFKALDIFLHCSTEWSTDSDILLIENFVGETEPVVLKKYELEYGEFKTIIAF